jgi:hypothetical protein
MALTLTEASKLSNDMLLRGVVETVIKDSPVLQQMPFIEVMGNSLTYNRENTLPGIDFYDVGDTWNESTPTFEQKTANLKIVGGDADVDNFLKATRSNVQDLEAAVIEMKAKALRHKFEEIFIYGDSETSIKQFDGIRKLIDTENESGQVIAVSASGDTLTLDKLDELIDAVKGGKPDMLLMSRRSRRKINSLVRASGSMLATEPRQLGNLIQLWDGIPIGVNDWILDTHTVADSVETATTGGSSSRSNALQFRRRRAMRPFQPGFYSRAYRATGEQGRLAHTRVKWYCSRRSFHPSRHAALIGVQD